MRIPSAEEIAEDVYPGAWSSVANLIEWAQSEKEPPGPGGSSGITRRGTETRD